MRRLQVDLVYAAKKGWVDHVRLVCSFLPERCADLDADDEVLAPSSQKSVSYPHLPSHLYYLPS